MTSPKQIVTQLLTILKAATTLKSVKKWYTAEPPFSRAPGFPFGWVEWNGGPMEPPVTSGKQVIRDSFSIVCVCKSLDFEKAEEEALTLVETVESVLDDYPTINALVSASWVSNREKQKLFEKNDYSIVAVRVTLSSWRRE